MSTFNTLNNRMKCRQCIVNVLSFFTVYILILFLYSAIKEDNQFIVKQALKVFEMNKSSLHGHYFDNCPLRYKCAAGT